MKGRNIGNRLGCFGAGACGMGFGFNHGCGWMTSCRMCHQCPCFTQLTKDEKREILETQKAVLENQLEYVEEELKSIK